MSMHAIVRAWIIPDALFNVKAENAAVDEYKYKMV